MTQQDTSDVCARDVHDSSADPRVLGLWQPSWPAGKQTRSMNDRLTLGETRGRARVVVLSGPLRDSCRADPASSIPSLLLACVWLLGR
jgi:hypothetical protein